MIISKNSFPKNVIFLCIVLKNDFFEVKSYVLYWKMRNEDFEKLFPKKFAFLCIILKNEAFEVNSFVLYWKMRISKKLFSEKDSIFYVLYWKVMYSKSILLFCTEKWGFVKTLFWIEFHSYVLYWKMMYLKSIPLFCIKIWGMRIS